METEKDKKLEILLDLYKKAEQNFKANPKELEKICKNILVKNKIHYASLAVVANSISNLDEVLTKSYSDGKIGGLFFFTLSISRSAMPLRRRPSVVFK